jgi:hypothetical protein
MRPFDPGLQAQRTALAWNRTALVFAVNALLVLRFGIRNGHVPLLMMGAVFGAFAGVFAAIGLARRSELAHEQVRAPGNWQMLFTAAATGLVALGCLWIVLD